MQSNRVGYVIKRVQQSLRSRMDSALRKYGITTPQYAALFALESDAPLSGAELARRCFVTPQTMNGIIVALEKADLVHRAPHAEHGRVIETHLTRAGRSLVRRAHTAVEGIEESMLAGFSPREHQALLDALTRCADQLEQTRP